MNQQQEKYYNEKLNEYEFINYTNHKLTFSHSLPGYPEERLMDAERSLPLLRRFFKNKNCPVTKLTIDRCTILKKGILDILKENKTITEFNITYCSISYREFLNEVADFLKGNQTIKKLGLHLFMSYYGVNEKNPEPRKVFKSLLGTSVTHLDLRENFLDFNILEDLKEVIPKLKLQSLNLRRNLKEKTTKKLEETVIYILRKNIFLENVFVEGISFDTRKKLEKNIEENKCIRKFFKIFLDNYGPKRLGLMDAQRTESIRDSKKPRLNLDVRRIIDEYIPRNIEEGVDNFISYLENIEKCLEGVRGYDITDFVHGKSDISIFKENKDKIDSVIKKLKRYAGYHNYTLTGRNTSYTNLTLGKKQTRGRKRKSTQINDN
jgi:hypothetical protein